MDKIHICDVTLRDGIQAPGFEMSISEKIATAKMLERLNVGIIEAGFARANDNEYDSIVKIAKWVGGYQGSPIISSLARANNKDIDAAGKAIEKAKHKRIHTFISTADLHIFQKYKKDRAWVLEQTVKSVSRAKQFTDDVQFSFEIFSQSDPQFLLDVAVEALNAGATTLNLPDTTGYSLPSQYYQQVLQFTNGIHKLGFNPIISVHTHNDIGMATANSIMGLEAGATQIECTLNGIGERAGNAALEEVVAAIDLHNLGDTEINLGLIKEASNLIVDVTGVPIQRNKAIVGENAFSHKSGIHQHGMQSDASTYEILDPGKFGMKSKTVMGSHSGKHAFEETLKRIGYDLTDDVLAKSMSRYSNQFGKNFDDANAVSAVFNTSIPKTYQLIDYVSKKLGAEQYQTSLKLSVDGIAQHELVATGDGEIDAGINAIKKILGIGYDITKFDSKSLGQKSDALANSHISIDYNNIHVVGKSHSTSVAESAFKAYLDGVNRLEYCLDMYDNYKNAS